MILILISIILVIIIVIISVYYYNKFIKNKDKCKNADYPVITHKKQINGFPNLNMGDVCWKNEEDINKNQVSISYKPFRNNILKSDRVGQNSVAEQYSLVLLPNIVFFVDCSRSMAITIYIDGLVKRSRHCGHFEPKNRFVA